MYLCRAITEDNLHVRTDRLCTHADAATKEEARRFVEQKLGEIEISVDNLRAQIAGETYRLLPLSYIAEHYFGKSAAWLSQRLNGTLVRGRSYTLKFSTTQRRISAFVSDQPICSDDSFAVIFSPQIPTTLGKFYEKNSIK